MQPKARGDPEVLPRRTCSDQIAEYGNRKDELFCRHSETMQPIPGVVEFLDCLSEAGIRTAIATSCQSASTACGTLEELNLACSFHTIVTGGRHPIRKARSLLSTS